MNVKTHPVTDHLVAMTDDTGLIQHATHDVPNRATGYCTDDIARALIVAVNLSRRSTSEVVGTRLVTTYLSYLHDAQMHDGWFHNFMGYDRTWQDRRGTPDSFGRTIWALGYCMRYAPRESWRTIARTLLSKALVHIVPLDHLRPRAYVALGLVHALHAAPQDAGTLRPALASALDAIAIAFDRCATFDWVWCQPFLTYDNARLAEALMRGGGALDDSRLRGIGLRMFAFYRDVVIEDDIFVPIGNDGWYFRGGVRARYGQQPIEAAAMVDAALAARFITDDSRYSRTAEIAYEWFFGANTAHATLVVNGGCCDGIDRSGPNPNMGAESTLAYLQSALAMAKPSAARLQLVR